MFKSSGKPEPGSQIGEMKGEIWQHRVQACPLHETFTNLVIIRTVLFPEFILIIIDQVNMTNLVLNLKFKRGNYYYYKL